MSQVKFDVAKLRKRIATLGTDIKWEANKNYVAAKILVLLLENKPVSVEQIKFLKEQSIDFTKVLAIIGLQAVPGSSFAIILLEKIGKKYGFTILPKADRKLPNGG